MNVKARCSGGERLDLGLTEAPTFLGMLTSCKTKNFSMASKNLTSSTRTSPRYANMVKHSRAEVQGNSKGVVCGISRLLASGTSDCLWL